MLETEVFACPYQAPATAVVFVVSALSALCRSSERSAISGRRALMLSKIYIRDVTYDADDVIDGRNGKNSAGKV